MKIIIVVLNYNNLPHSYIFIIYLLVIIIITYWVYAKEEEINSNNILSRDGN